MTTPRTGETGTDPSAASRATAGAGPAGQDALRSSPAATAGDRGPTKDADPPLAPPDGPPRDPGTNAGPAQRRPTPPRTVPPRPAPSRASRPPEPARPTGRSRRARLALHRIDPWSVFVFTLVASLFLGVALVVAVGTLYAVLDSLGVLTSVNDLYVEVLGGDDTAPLFTSRRFLGGAAVLAAVNVVLLTLLATLSALLYNLCASFTGGVEVTFGERDS